MKEFTKSLFSYSLAVSLFGLKQIDNLFGSAGVDDRKSPATKSFDSLTTATTEQFGATLKSTFRAVDNLQRGLIGIAFSVMFPFAGSGRSERIDLEAAEPRRWTEVMECPEPAPTYDTEPVSIDGRLL